MYMYNICAMVWIWTLPNEFIGRNTFNHLKDECRSHMPFWAELIATQLLPLLLLLLLFIRFIKRIWANFIDKYGDEIRTIWCSCLLLIESSFHDRLDLLCAPLLSVCYWLIQFQSDVRLCMTSIGLDHKHHIIVWFSIVLRNNVAKECIHCICIHIHAYVHSSFTAEQNHEIVHQRRFDIFSGDEASWYLSV